MWSKSWGSTKPTQELRRDLKDIAHLLMWSAVDLMQLAALLSEAGLETEALELVKKLEAFKDAEDKLAGYIDEVKTGQITRAKP
ncbi:hypothetical protein TU84_19445 [Pseudomonas helleri]|nr:hypothetical protein TU84_19445 [Pseudomonas helleri]